MAARLAPAVRWRPCVPPRAPAPAETAATIIFWGAAPRHPPPPEARGPAPSRDTAVRGAFAPRYPHLKENPDVIWGRHVYHTFQDDVPGMRLRDLIGVDKMMWGSDYPHFDSTWPNTTPTTSGSSCSPSSPKPTSMPASPSVQPPRAAPAASCAPATA